MTYQRHSSLTHSLTHQPISLMKRKSDADAKIMTNSKKEWVTVLDSDSDFESAPKFASKKNSGSAPSKASEEERKNKSPKAPNAFYMAEYILEIAKSGRAECKKCNFKIAKDELRVGVVVQGDRWVTTNWQHLACTIFPPTIRVVESMNGFCGLSADVQAQIRDRVQSSWGEVDPDDVPIDPNELVRMNWSEEMEPANELLMPLLPYQKEGLGWMVHQEKSATRGGILADEMGMGKTIQAIGLLLANKPDPRHAVQQKLWKQVEVEHLLLVADASQQGAKPVNAVPAATARDGRKKPGSASSMSRGQTLVIVPTVALRQWQAEILRFTREGALTVSVYHGSSRGELTQRLLMGADVVLTTFKILEVEYRKATALAKMPCSVCGKKYYPDKYRLHRKYFCGDDAQMTSAQSKTQRKGRRGWGAGNERNNDDDVISVDDSDSSEDEIDRQKKFIKAMKEKESLKTAGSGPKKGGSRANKRAAVSVEESSSEDEIDRQKKMIKALKEHGEGRNTKTGPAATKATAKTKSSKPSSKKQRFESQRIAGEKQEAPRHNKNSTKGNTQETKSNKGKGKSKSKSKGKGKGRKRGSDKDSDYDDDSCSSGESGSDSSASDTDNDEPLAFNKRKRGSAAKASGSGSGRSVSTGTKAKKVLKKKTRTDKSDSNNSETSSDEKEGGAEGKDEDGDDFNPEVEREIEAALRRSSRQVVPSLLHAISWFRVILDEAHLIKDRASSTAKAVFNLISLHKWCLTGTPLQNRVGELFSLVRFLRLDPHSYYFCRAKDCSCKSLHYKFSKGRCDVCSHTSMQHYSHFNKHILNPIKRMGYTGEGRKGMLTLKNEILDEVLLRRTKDTRADDIQLPPRIVKVRLDSLDPFEEDFYEAMYTQSQAQFNTYVDAGTVLNNYAHIFDILIRLRQVVDHPYLVLHSSTKAATVGGVTYGDDGLPKSLAEMSASGNRQEGGSGFNDESGLRRSSRVSLFRTAQEEEDEGGEETLRLCGFCHEPPSAPVHANCTHVFCESCVTDYLHVLEADDDGASSALCPLCSEALSLVFDKEIAPSSIAEAQTYLPRGQAGTGRGRKNFVNKLDLRDFQSSTKLEALMQELHAMRQRDYGAKAIVFSQFVNMLDLTEYRLERGGFKCGKLTGSLTVDQRDKIIQSFNTDQDVSVLLISLKAGGVALNLTAANHIFIMDPWWNPAAEMQAIDRTHRIGQHKPIHATRFIVQNTIEERILQLQEKKRLVFDGTIGGDAGAMARLNVEDMRFLFQ